MVNIGSRLHITADMTPKHGSQVGLGSQAKQSINCAPHEYQYTQAKAMHLRMTTGLVGPQPGAQIRQADCNFLAFTHKLPMHE